MSLKDDFLFYHKGIPVYLDDDGNYFVMDGQKKITFATEKELIEYLEES